MPFAAQICTWPPLLAFLAIAATFFAFSGVGLLLRLRLLQHERLKAHHEAAGILFNMVGVLYAVVVASVAVGVWEQFSQATLVAEQETGSMLAVTRLVKYHPAPSPAVEELKASIHRYASLVKDQEFPMMGRMARSAETVEAFQTVWRNAEALKPASEQESNIQQAILANLGDAQKFRVARLLVARRGLPGSLWLVLGLSSAITVAFSLCFSVEDAWLQVLMVAAEVLVASLVVYAVVSLNYPFTGHVAVSPEGWTFVLRHSQ